MTDKEAHDVTHEILRRIQAEMVLMKTDLADVKAMPLRMRPSAVRAH
jgi:hypothetical protein